MEADIEMGQHGSAAHPLQTVVPLHQQQYQPLQQPAVALEQQQRPSIQITTHPPSVQAFAGQQQASPSFQPPQPLPAGSFQSPPKPFNPRRRASQSHVDAINRHNLSHSSTSVVSSAAPNSSDHLQAHAASTAGYSPKSSTSYSSLSSSSSPGFGVDHLSLTDHHSNSANTANISSGNIALSGLPATVPQLAHSSSDQHLYAQILSSNHAHARPQWSVRSQAMGLDDGQKKRRLSEPGLSASLMAAAMATVQQQQLARERKNLAAQSKTRKSPSNDSSKPSIQRSPQPSPPSAGKQSTSISNSTNTGSSPPSSSTTGSSASSSIAKSLSFNPLNIRSSRRSADGPDPAIKATITPHTFVSYRCVHPEGNTVHSAFLAAKKSKSTKSDTVTASTAAASNSKLLSSSTSMDLENLSASSALNTANIASTINEHSPLHYQPLAHRRLLCLTSELPEFYSRCNPQFHYSRTANPRRILTEPSERCLNDGYDNAQSNLVLCVNDVLHSDSGTFRSFRVLELLGEGTFGQVVKCEDCANHKLHAIKVIKNKPAYYNQALMEIRLLTTLNNQYDPNDQHHMLRLLDHFTYKHHLCLVFELLSVNLYELIKQNQFRGLAMHLIRTFLRQLVESLIVLRKASIIHCDLKPENILLQELSRPQIKLIDFGSACFESQTVYAYIQSRFYRSPEVLFGLPYNCCIDMWSLGCIAAELFLGLPLFPGVTQHNQIERIVKFIGFPPSAMLDVGKSSTKFFHCQTVNGRNHWTLKSAVQYADEHKTAPVVSKVYFKGETLAEVVELYPVRKSFTPDQIQQEKSDRACFLHFLQGLLRWEPHLRWTPQQTAQHPFLTKQPFNTFDEHAFEQLRFMETGTAVASFNGISNNLSTPSPSPPKSNLFALASPRSSVSIPAVAAALQATSLNTIQPSPTASAAMVQNWWQHRGRAQSWTQAGTQPLIPITAAQTQPPMPTMSGTQPSVMPQSAYQPAFPPHPVASQQRARQKPSPSPNRLSNPTEPWQNIPPAAPITAASLLSQTFLEQSMQSTMSPTARQTRPRQGSVPSSPARRSQQFAVMGNQAYAPHTAAYSARPLKSSSMTSPLQHSSAVASLTGKRPMEELDLSHSNISEIDESYDSHRGWSVSEEIESNEQQTISQSSLSMELSRDHSAAGEEAQSFAEWDPFFNEHNESSPAHSQQNYLQSQQRRRSSQFVSSPHPPLGQQSRKMSTDSGVGIPMMATGWRPPSPSQSLPLTHSQPIPRQRSNSGMLPAGVMAGQQPYHQQQRAQNIPTNRGQWIQQAPPPQFSGMPQAVNQGYQYPSHHHPAMWSSNSVSSVGGESPNLSPQPSASPPDWSQNATWLQPSPPSSAIFAVAPPPAPTSKQRQNLRRGSLPANAYSSRTAMAMATGQFGMNQFNSHAFVHAHYHTSTQHHTVIPIQSDESLSLISPGTSFPQPSAPMLINSPPSGSTRPFYGHPASSRNPVHASSLIQYSPAGSYSQSYFNQYAPPLSPLHLAQPLSQSQSQAHSQMGSPRMCAISNSPAQTQQHFLYQQQQQQHITQQQPPKR